MNISVWLHAKNTNTLLECYQNHTTEAVLHDLRRHWNEEETGSQLFVLLNDDGEFLASIHRDPLDDEVATTMYANGKTERHRCKYILTDDGKYERTEITKF